MTFIVGIDIAKYHHECLVLNLSGEVIHNSFSFDNNKQGFQYLLSILSSLSSDNLIKIGFESTGHYGNNLKNFLTTSGFSFMEIHPVLINRFSKASTLRKTKTDKVDAHMICSYLMSVEFKPYPTKSYHIASLKSLTRARDSLVKERSLQLQRLTNILDLIFPEFKPFFNDSLKSATAQYILFNYKNPSKISGMNLTSYNKMKSKLRRTISYAKFCELKSLAVDTVGTQDDLLTFQLNTYLELYTHLNESIHQTEKLIHEEYEHFSSHIHTIPGIGIISAAGIFSEIGDINRFNQPDQLVAFCGLDPAFYQSGETEYTGKMVKRGSSHFRQYIMNCAQFTLMHNPILYDFYRKKRDEGKPHRVALSHVAKKLLRIIFKIESSDTNFDISKLI